MFVKSVYDPEVATAANVGVPDKSVYDPEVATAASVGLFRILATPVVAFQSDGVSLVRNAERFGGVNVNVPLLLSSSSDRCNTQSSSV